MPDRFFIVDGHSQIYRAILTPGQNLTSPDGEPTRGTYYFTRMLRKLVNEKRPDYFCIALDSKRTALERKRLFPGYKSDRPDPDDSIVTQLRRIKQILKALRVTTVSVPGWEADDIIATLVDTCESDEVHCVIVSRDKDLHQLVSERTRLFDPQADEYIGIEEVEDKWGVGPDKVLEIQTLTGDTTDGVPGVPGVGPKKALALIKEYGTVEGVLENLEDLPPKLRDTIDKTDLDLARRLVELRRDLELELGTSDLEFEGLDLRNAQPLFRKLGFRRWTD